MKANIRIGDVLIARGFLKQEQLSKALEEQKKDRSKRLGEILIELSYITEDQLLLALCERLELKYVDLVTETIDLEAVEIIPKSLSARYNVIAYKKTDNFITLAVNDPLDFYAIEDVKSFFDRQCELVICKSSSIKSCINKSYSEIEARNAMSYVNTSVQNSVQEVVADVEINSSLSPVVNVVNSVIIKAYLEGASDIHFEPFEKLIKVRLRVDGQLLNYTELDVNLALSLATRIKILADLDIAERRIPQDGNFKLMLSGKNVSIRVSTIPTAFGEKIVLRFLSRDVAIDNGHQYGMTEDNYIKISRILANPHGMVYITGPTGSGKTTTLYMMIERLAKQNINVSTIEDPIERNLENINQVQVNVPAGLTFESGLRSMLRQDPDVLLIGETRDSETAQIAVSAAITGHLVLSTLHTNDSISTIVRLQNMGVPDYLVANSLVGVVAQRLIKKVCPFCKETYYATPADKAILPDAQMLVRGKGCNACNNSGYKGRIAVHEILEIDSNIKDMIATDVPMQQIYDYASENGKMNFIKDDIGKLVLSGVTTMEEYLKHCPIS